MTGQILNDSRANRDYPADRPPIDGYQSLTIPQILEKLATMPEPDVRKVRDWEKSHRRRKTLLVRLERRLRDTDNPNVR